MYILGFIACGIIILFAGRRITLYGDLFAEKTGIGKAFVGIFLMSAVTSLPELMVGVSSSAIIQSADLAVGDLLGSCAFNLVILSFIEIFSKNKSPLLSRVSQSHIFAASLGAILISSVGMGIFLRHDIILLPFIGLNSILFVLIYFIAIRIIYRYQQSHPPEKPENNHESEQITLRQIVLKFSLFAIITIIAALFVPFFADKLSEQSGMGKSFVGTFFLAVSTSLPEIAVTFAAIKMNSTDLAVGNVLGSNLFNVFILFIDDLFYTKGHILKDASDSNLISVFSIIIMSAIVIISITYKNAEKRYFIGLDTFLLFVIYVVTMILLYYF